MFTIAGYTPTELVHTGAGAVIYRGYRDVDHAKVIIKTHRSDFPTALDRAKLRHERSLLSELAGPGIAAVDPLAMAGGRVALVMEDVGLQSLDFMLSGRLDLGIALRVVLGVASVLGRAHQRGIVHKDIKPHNILVGLDPLSVYVIDWGIASRLRDAHGGDGAEKLPDEGTLAYLAPEQTGLMNRAIDARADLYSLGVTLYELLTGARPFNDETPLGLVHSHLTKVPASPTAVDGRIPAQASAIAMKLLSKSADDRYASARGLGRDLEECLSQWTGSGHIAPFPLGRHDRSSELRIPEKLYGREADVAAVLAASRRVKTGSAELLLIAGHGGIGKSAIVREARGPMRLEGAKVASGKFEQIRSAAPYASLTQAFRELIRQVMTEPPSAVAAVRARLLEALDQNAGVMVELLPELERVVGPQPPVPALGPLEAENRFNRVLRRFVSVFATEERPLVLFLDDMQWAEPASLGLLQRILTDPDQRHLLVIGAYRDREEAALELLRRALAGIAEAGGAISKISLRPLDPEDVRRLVADALRVTAAEVEPLAAQIFEKTGGNPFFVAQLLTSLGQDGLIAFDEDAAAFRWDLPAIAARSVTDNVADFMAERLRRLPPAALHLLQIAACLGAELDHDTLAKIARQSTAECARGLWDAIAEGVLVPLHGDYRLLEGLSGDDASAASRVRYRFLHDRVQEAAYSLLADGEKARVHLEIARQIRAISGAEIPDDQVFAVADHLDIGRALVTGRAERVEAAEVNLRAGRRARMSVAHAAARSYLSHGIEILPDDAWEAAYELCFALHNERAASVFLCGDVAEASALFDALIARARSPLDEVDVHVLRLQLFAASSRYSDVVRTGMRALSVLGAGVPETEEGCKAAFDAEMPRLIERLRGRSVDDLLGAPPMTDPRAKAALRILLVLDTPAFGAGQPKLSALTSLRHVLLSLEHGPSELSACGYAVSALMLLRLFGPSEEADLMSRVAAALEDRYPCPEFASKLSFTRANAAAITRPAAEAIARYERAAEVSLQYGDLSMWQISGIVSLALRVVASDEDLAAVRARSEQARTTMRRAKYEAATMLTDLGLRAIVSLMDPEIPRGSFDADGFDEAALLALARERGMAVVLGCYWFYKIMVLCLLCEHEAVIPLLEELAERTPVLSQAMRANMALYLAVTAAALLDAAEGAEAARYRALFDAQERLLAEQRSLGEEAWRPHHLLVSAERARLRGEDMEAQRLYNECLDVAQQAGNVRIFTLGSERYGRFAASKGLDRAARGAFNDAHQAALSWGAAARAEALVARFGRFLAPTGQAHQTGRPNAPTTKGTATVALQGVLLDLGEAMRTAHAISSEIMIDRIIERFLRASSQSAAARRAFVILAKGSELVIAGQLEADPDEVRTGDAAPLSSTVALCEAVVRYVARSREPVILGAPEDSSQFADDSYLRERRPKSLVCLPLVHHDRLLGVFYAESDSASQLRQGSVELLQVLCGHAGSALANARLYEELKAASAELSDKNERLVRELTERERMEVERAELQERIIQMQDDLLLELSTPLIPIRDRVIVIPIVGAIGEKRRAHMVETVLAGAHERRARAVIIDITGLRQVDDGTARTLIKMASSLRILGVSVILTGVRPDVAMAVVEMDLEMQGIEVRSTLEAGIALATARRDRSMIIR